MSEKSREKVKALKKDLQVIENAAVKSYKAIETGTVGAYKAIETIEEAKKRINSQLNDSGRKE